MKKNITLVENTNEIFKAQQLTIGLDLGDRSSHYCILVLDETGNVILEQSVPTTPKQVFSKISIIRARGEVARHQLLSQSQADVHHDSRLLTDARPSEPRTATRTWNTHPHTRGLFSLS